MTYRKNLNVEAVVQADTIEKAYLSSYGRFRDQIILEVRSLPEFRHLERLETQMIRKLADLAILERQMERKLAEVESHLRTLEEQHGPTVRWS